MRRGKPHGYTIVEVMIFLAVTGLLFAMIALTFSGQRGRTQFQTAARDIESRARDVINDTSSGFYSRPADFTCQESGGAPTFNTNPSDHGSNEECIFIGRVAQFNVDGNGNDYNVYTVAGLRKGASTGREATDFSEAQPRAVVGSVDLTEEFLLPAGAEAVSMYYRDGAANVPIQAIGFFSTFGEFDGDRLRPGSLAVNLIPLEAGGNSEAQVVNAISNLSTQPFVTNPPDGVVVCINSQTSDQHAVLTVGGEGGPLTADMFIDNGKITPGDTCHVT